jgi:hypothetical protein
MVSDRGNISRRPHPEQRWRRGIGLSAKLTGRLALRVLDLDGREVHSKVKGTIGVSVCVALRILREFLSPKVQWMAASRKERPFLGARRTGHHRPIVLVSASRDYARFPGKEWRESAV